jgi:hypothetical protein
LEHTIKQKKNNQSFQFTIIESSFEANHNRQQAKKPADDSGCMLDQCKETGNIHKPMRMKRMTGNDGNHKTIGNHFERANEKR